MSNAGSIDITTNDNPFVIDSVKRCKGRAGIIESGKLIWRNKEESMGRACAVSISAHHPVPIIQSEQDCRNRARGIDREVQRPIGVAVLPVKDS